MKRIKIIAIFLDLPVGSLTDGSLQQRTVYLFSDIILTASSSPFWGSMQKVGQVCPRSLTYIYLPDKKIPLETSWVIDRPDGFVTHAFWLVSHVKTHLFVLPSHRLKREWSESPFSCFFVAKSHFKDGVNQ